jgi:hypothetical protein
MPDKPECMRIMTGVQWLLSRSMETAELVSWMEASAVPNERRGLWMRW